MPLSPTNDRDLLIRLDTKMDGLSAAFNKIEIAVSTKADAARVDKLETHLSLIERKVYTICGGLAVLEIVLRWFSK